MDGEFSFNKLEKYTAPVLLHISIVYNISKCVKIKKKCMLCFCAFHIKQSTTNILIRSKKCGTLHDFACHPCAGAMLIFSVSFQF